MHAVDDVGYLAQDGLIHVLVGPVVVRTIADASAKPVGAGPLTHQHVGHVLVVRQEELGLAGDGKRTTSPAISEARPAMPMRQPAQMSLVGHTMGTSSITLHSVQGCLQ